MAFFRCSATQRIFDVSIVSVILKSWKHGEGALDSFYFSKFNVKIAVAFLYFQFVLTFLGSHHVWSKGLLSHKMSNEDGNKRPQNYLDKTQQKTLNWNTKLLRR